MTILCEKWKELNYDSNESFQNKKAKMFPINKSKTTDEVNTTSIFLSCLEGIKEFREKLLLTIGVNKITNKSALIHTYTELQEMEVGTDARPDGLILLTTGKTLNIDWSAFVEVKTKGLLKKEQIEKYLEKCTKNKVDSIITISNEVVVSNNFTPVLNMRNRKNLFHFSWKQIETILSEVIYSGIEDEDQVYLAKQLLAYIQKHPDITHFNVMSPEWKESSEKIVEKKGKTSDFENVAINWTKEENDMSLQLRKKFYCDISFLKKDEEKSHIERVNNKIKEVKERDVLSTNFNITSLSDTYFPKNKFLDIELNFNGRFFKITKNFTIDKKTPKAKIDNLLNILDKSEVGREDDILIKPILQRNKELNEATFKQLKEMQERDKRHYELLGITNDVDIKHFEVYTKINLNNDFYNPKLIIKKMEESLMSFYTSVIKPFN